MLGGNLNKDFEKDKINDIAEEIKELLKEEKTLTIPKIMKKFNINAMEAIEAVEILRKKGIVEEIDD